MKAHDLARHLLRCENLEVTASIDISTCDEDSDRSIFTTDCRGINLFTGEDGIITILFDANPEDNYGNTL